MHEPVEGGGCRWAVVVVLGVGCGPAAPGDDGSGSVGSTGPFATDSATRGTGTGPGGSTTNSSGNSTSATGSCVGLPGAFFDVCWDPSDLPDSAECGGVDLLFVVDGSLSMDPHRQAFVAVVGDLVGQLYGVGIEDVHAMVVDVDKRNSLCADTCNQDPNGNCLGQTCSQIPGTDACAGLLGAGLREDGSGSPCGLPLDRAFVDFTQDSDPLAILQCLLDPGLPGDLEERPADAMRNALLHTPTLELLGCNDGFPRADAMPVVILLSDEDDDFSQGTPAEWGAQVAGASVGGEPVVLAMLGDPDRVQPICTSADPDAGGATPAPRLRELLATTKWGFGPSICSPDYGPIALDMADVIEAACSAWTPPG